MSGFSFKDIYSRLKKDSAVVQEIMSGIQLWPDGSIPTPESYEDYTKLYETVLWVYACIWAIASHGAMVPYHIVEMVEKPNEPEEADKKEVSYGHPARAFFRNPNPTDTFDDIIEALLTFLELNGDAYLEKVFADGAATGELKEIYPLRPDRVHIHPLSSGRGISKYSYKIKRWKKGIDFAPEFISHFKYFSPNNDFYGQSTLAAATKTILLEQYATQFQEMTLKNNAVPQGVIETDYDVEDEEMVRIKKKWIQTYQGVKKAGEIAILPLGLRFKPMSYHPRDLEWKNLLANNREKLFAVTGVNNAILGILENMTYDNYRMQVRSFFMNIMKPKMKKIAARLTKDILPHFGENLYFEFDFSSFLAEDEAELSSRFQREIQNGMLNPNEARDMLDRKSYEGGDTFYMAANLQPIASGTAEFQTPEERQSMQNQDKQELDNTNQNVDITASADLPEEDDLELEEIERRLNQDKDQSVARGTDGPSNV